MRGLPQDVQHIVANLCVEDQLYDRNCRLVGSIKAVARFVATVRLFVAMALGVLKKWYPRRSGR